MNIGDIVTNHTHGNGELRSGASYYKDAVVCSVTPFILVSQEGDMRWDSAVKQNYVVIGTAKPELLAKCMQRLTSVEIATGSVKLDPVPDCLIVRHDNCFVASFKGEYVASILPNDEASLTEFMEALTKKVKRDTVLALKQEFVKELPNMAKELESVMRPRMVQRQSSKPSIFDRIFGF